LFLLHINARSFHQPYLDLDVANINGGKWVGLAKHVGVLETLGRNDLDVQPEVRAVLRVAAVRLVGLGTDKHHSAKSHSSNGGSAETDGNPARTTGRDGTHYMAG
jgi:hypothetical protein